MLLTLSK